MTENKSLPTTENENLQTAEKKEIRTAEKHLLITQQVFISYVYHVSDRISEALSGQWNDRNLYTHLPSQREIALFELQARNLPFM